MLDILKQVPEKVVHKYLGAQKNYPQAAFTILYDEPKSANEVMGSKEGCRAIFSTYDQNIYLHGGRGIKAITKIEIYNPIKN